MNDLVRQIEDSGILSAESLRPFLPPHAAPSTARDLAIELVRRKKLTKYQAEEALKGRAGRLILGNYLLLNRIGAGGMGQVFKARHRRMEREVAIKLLSPELVRQPGAIARFEREAKAAARLSHPNIITAHDADEAGGFHFLVMEYVAGIDLSDLVRKQGPQSVGRSLDIVLQTARGLEAAHAAGIIHRDIKPGNLLLDASGTVKILDMGLARLESQAINGDAPELTTTGAVMGTVDYMAPEQAIDAKNADARADIYALGCTLHWLLTGKAPYDGATLVARLLAHRDKPIPRIGRSASVPEGVERVFSRMVAKSPHSRYPNMSAVIADLEQLRSDLSTSSESSSPLLSEQTLDAFPAFSESKPTFNGTDSRQPAPQRHSPSRLYRNQWAVIATGVAGVVMFAGLFASVPGRHRAPVGRTRRAEGSGTGPKAKEQAEVLGTRPEKGPLPTLDNVAPERSVQGSEVASGSPKIDLAFRKPGFDLWLTSVSSLPAEQQVDEVRKKMTECNPGFDPTTLIAHLDGRVVSQVICPPEQVTDLSPLRGFSGLRHLTIAGLPTPVCPLVDLTPLKGLALQSIDAGHTNVSDIRPLAGMPLTDIKLGRTRVSSLEPLRGMPIVSLSLDGCPLESLGPLEGSPIRYLSIPSTGIVDLSPLQGARIEALVCANNPLHDLSPLAGAPIVDLNIESTGVSDLVPLRNSPLRRLFISFTKVEDLRPLAGKQLLWLSMASTSITNLEPLRDAPLETLSYEASPVTDVKVLEGMPLKGVAMTYDEQRDGAVLRRIRSLEQINGKPVVEFWREQASGR